MKLAIVTSYPPSKVTLNEYAYHLIKNFRQQKEVSEIVILTDVSEEQVDVSFDEMGCSVKVMSCWKFNSYNNIFSIAKAINNIKPDAVLYNLQFMKFGDKKIPAALGLFSPWISKRILRIKTIVLLHNIMETVDLESAGFTTNGIKKKLYTVIGQSLTRVLLKADKVAVTIGQYARILETKYKSSNCVVIPHGTFDIPQESSYAIGKGPLKVMTFGKFGTYKKVENLIEAIQLVRASTKREIELVIAGTDNPNTRGYLKGIQQEYHSVPNITFTGYVKEEDVPTLFAESAMVVFPYTSTTGSSGVLHQAGSYGKAVVMPDIGDLNILVKDEGYRGEFFMPGSTESLANAIERLVIHDKYRMALAQANYNAAVAFPMTKIVQMYLEAFNPKTLEQTKKLKTAA